MYPVDNKCYGDCKTASKSRYYDYEQITTSTSRVCKICAYNRPDCELCEDHIYCLKCFTKFLRTDRKGCVSNCLNEDPYRPAVWGDANHGNG